MLSCFCAAFATTIVQVMEKIVQGDKLAAGKPASPLPMAAASALVGL